MVKNDNTDKMKTGSQQWKDQINRLCGDALKAPVRTETLFVEGVVA